MSALVSVIIPVYNAEKYIENCLKSVINQTYDNLEIICVDDGSKDSSGLIIKKLCTECDKIKYIFQENAGVSAARNNGLSEASGDFIVFLDSDDYIHPQTVELFIDCQSKTDADIVCCKDKHTNKTDEETSEISDYDYNHPEYEYLFGNESGRLCRCVWGKLIKSSIAKEYKFPLLKTGEDLYYMILLLSNNPKISLIQKDLWFYYSNEASLSRTASVEAEFDMLCWFDRLFADIQITESGFLKAYTLETIYKSVFRLRSRLSGSADQKTILKECKKYGRKWLKTLLICNYINPKTKIMYLAFCFSRQVYEKAMILNDPTMKDYYNSLRK